MHYPHLIDMLKAMYPVLVRGVALISRLSQPGWLACIMATESSSITRQIAHMDTEFTALAQMMIPRCPQQAAFLQDLRLPRKYYNGTWL